LAFLGLLSAVGDATFAADDNDAFADADDDNEDDDSDSFLFYFCS
jgi:hypothetical protein